MSISFLVCQHCPKEDTHDEGSFAYFFLVLRIKLRSLHIGKYSSSELYSQPLFVFDSRSTCYIAQVGLELLILLPLFPPLVCWSYRIKGTMPVKKNSLVITKTKYHFMNITRGVQPSGPYWTKSNSLRPYIAEVSNPWPTGYQSTHTCFSMLLEHKGCMWPTDCRLDNPWKTSVKVALTLSRAVTSGEGKSL